MSDDKKTPEELAAEEAAKKAAEEASKKKAEDDEKKKVKKFDTEQTAFINKLFSEAFKEGAAKVESEMAAKLEDEKKEREKLAAQLAELTKTKDEKKDEQKPNPELDAFKAQLTEMQGILTGIKTERDDLKKRVETADQERRKSRKKDEFLNAMKEANVSFFDPLEAYDLAEKSGYDWDTSSERPVVLNKETNRPKLNENGEAMSVIDFVKDFAERKKYLVKAPTSDGGTGAGENRKHEGKKKDEAPDFASMTNEEFEAYTQKILNKR